MAKDHRGRDLHAGKRSDDEMYEQLKKDTNGINNGYGPKQAPSPYEHPYTKMDAPKRLPESALMPHKKTKMPSDYYKQDMSKNVNYPKGGSTPDGY